MKELIKRMAEIRSRKVELRGVLETDAKADLDAIEKELRELDEEYTNLEKRKAVIEGIGAGTVPVNEVPNPGSSTLEGLTLPKTNSEHSLLVPPPRARLFRP